MDRHPHDKSFAQDSPSPDRRELLAALSRRQIPVSQHIVEFLHARGITHVFAINGSPIDPVIIGCSRIGIRVIGTRNQQSAVFASLALNYMAGGIRSAVVVSPGPALTNCTTGLLVAHDNQWPVLVISGRRSSLYKKGNFQELDGTSLLQPLCKYVAHVDSVSAVRESLEEAFRACSAQPSGAALLDFNEDILACKAVFRPVSSLAVESLTNPHDVLPAADVHTLLATLEHARRPVLIAGSGLRWSADWSALLGLVEAFSLPFVTVPMAAGFLPAGHALNYTSIRAQLLANADLVLIAGNAFDWTIRFGREIHPDARIVFLHNDPPVTDLANVVAFHTDSGLAMNALAALAATQTDCSARHVSDSAWLDELAAARASKHTAFGIRCRQPGQELSIFNWMAVLKDCIPAAGSHHHRRQRNPAGGQCNHSCRFPGEPDDAGAKRLHGDGYSLCLWRAPGHRQTRRFDHR